MTLDELIDKLESESDYNMICVSELVMYLKELRDARKLIESQAHYIGAYIDDEFRRR